MAATGTPEPPREATLIRTARLARGLTVDEAVGLLPIKLSVSRWWHIERGYKSKSDRVVAPARTLAHMAHVVGLTSDRLDEVGREDAGAVLREIEREQAAESSASSPPYANLADDEERIIWSWSKVPESTRRNLIDLLRSDRAKERRAG